MRWLAILLPQSSYPAGDNGALRAEWRPRSVHPFECDRQRGAVKRQRCFSVDGGSSASYIGCRYSSALSTRWRCWREKHILLAFHHTWTIISHYVSPPNIHVQPLYHCSTYRVCPPTLPDARSAMPHRRSGTAFPLKYLPATQKQLSRNT